jgi:hypothetical protein
MYDIYRVSTLLSLSYIHAAEWFRKIVDFRRIENNANFVILEKSDLAVKVG